MFSIVCSTNALPGLNRKTSIRSQDYSSTKSLRIFLAILLTVGLLACSVVEALAQSGEAESGMIAPRGLHPRLQKQGKRVLPRSGATVLAAPSGIQAPKSPATDNLGIIKGF